MNIQLSLMARHFQCAVLINKYRDYTLLDVGCRTMILKKLLTGCNKYCGTDIIPGDGILQCDLETTLPFSDAQFDIVVALDVLEHLDNIHACLYELLRIANKSLIISLPNMYYIKYRYNYMRGNLSGKYTFHASPMPDRHKWIPSYSQAINFIEYNCGGGGTILNINQSCRVEE